MRSRSKARGIPNDPRWDTFPGFLAHPPQGDWSPGACLCRNGDTGAYGPDNARWDTRTANSQEGVVTSGLVYLLPDGRKASDVARENGINDRRWRMRHQREGWDLLDAVTIPIWGKPKTLTPEHRAAISAGVRRSLARP